MNKFILLGISSGLNRAGIFLLFPALGLFMSVVDFGQLSIYLTLSSLLVALISFNITSVIAREVYSDLLGVLAYLKIIFYWLITLISFMVFLFLLTSNEIFMYFIFIIMESFFIVSSTYLRYRVSDFNFFKITLIKFSLLMLFFIFYFYSVRNNDFNVSVVLFILAMSNVIAFPTVLRIVRLSYPSGVFEYAKNRSSYFFFALGLVLHVFALWINSGVDRFFVKWYFDPEVLGVYSFAYSLSAIFLLVNAALSLALPQMSVKNFERYCSIGFRSKLFFFLFVLYLFFCFFLYLVVPYFNNYPHDITFRLSLLIVSGFFLLCGYTYFSSILFYKRKARLISFLTLGTMLITLTLLYPMTYLWGLWGTALVTYLCYMFYALITCWYADREAFKYMLIPIFPTVPVVFLSYY